MSDEVREFAQKVGAEEPEEGTDFYLQYRKRFRRPNYFMLNGKMIIIKISRSNPPFWGVGKQILDFLDPLDYILVLLTSSREGWIFDKMEIKRNITNGTWRQSGTDYKINRHTLLDRNSFFSPENFLIKIDEYDTRQGSQPDAE